MLRFTTKSSYGIRALIDLAVTYDRKQPVSLKNISGKERISLVFLEQIFNTFKKKGIVKSVRGPKGGYVLARDPSGISVCEVIKALEGDFYSGQCFPKKRGGKACARSKDCASKEIWDELTRQIEKTLKRFSLKYLAERTKERTRHREKSVS